MQKLLMIIVALGILAGSVSAKPYTLSSRASWYSLPGGAVGMQCAARHYPCGSILEVWNAKDRYAKHWKVRVTDYGPFVAGRELDLSPYAFHRVFGNTSKGVCKISYKLIHRGHCRIHKH